MENNIKICFVLTPAQVTNIIKNSPELHDEMDRAVLNGTSPSWDDVMGGSLYKFTAKAADAHIPDLLIDALFMFGVDEICLPYWCEVPDSALDNLVDIGWPRAKKVVIVDGIEIEERVQLQDYTTVQHGLNGTALVSCGAYEAGTSNYLSSGVDTAEWRERYKTKFGNLIFHNGLATWKSVNTVVSGTAG